MDGKQLKKSSVQKITTYLKMFDLCFVINWISKVQKGNNILMSRTKHYKFKVYFITAKSIKWDGFLFDIGVSVSLFLCVPLFIEWMKCG